MFYHTFKDTILSMLQIRHLDPIMFCCAVFSRLAILRIEGCLNSTIKQHYLNPLGARVEWSASSTISSA